MLLMCTFLLPFNAMFPHDNSKLLFLISHPLIPLCISPCATFKSKSKQCLFQRYPCLKPPLASCRIRYKIYMQVGRCFIHVKIGSKYSQSGIALPETLHIFIKHLCRKLSILCFCPILSLLPICTMISWNGFFPAFHAVFYCNNRQSDGHFWSASHCTGRVFHQIIRDIRP